MKKYLLLFIFSSLLSCKNNTDKHTEVKTTSNHLYLVRHAEKDTTNPEDHNPKLTPEGMLRAAQLSTILSAFPLQAVYATNYNRTLQTAKPTALKNNLEVTIYKPFTLKAKTLVTSNNNILIVGHSNTIPKLVNAIIKSDVYADINENDYGNLYHITITNGKVSSYELTNY
ncbi:SixA phosphatase family protein [Hyunsoonleella sp. 2307UL5-6]|uniref:SixA phosphatase family protein n=1 Tax=Hyunsoonleella sp. 2307UL5-6 TaxID=3384768 RepID=UPI0039BC44CB